ncbi:helicase-related protein [Thermosipho globiformans]|uniref:helicase-related protein n=1 Tax=Thermosipho globiformans TaxID=380685 RepID=UPI000F8CF33A|nr:helicase-related protein [Thermosipho globiformans]
MEMRTFITNKHKKLSETLKNISSSISKCYFLVGYFYFSGFSEIYEHYKDKELKILVGLDIEKGLDDIYKETYNIFKTEDKSKLSIREDYYNKLKEFINNTNYYDLSKMQEAFEVFLEKIKNGTLEIRKTKNSTHSKMYIFERKNKENGENPGYVIVGSSNFSASGLSSQNEVNVFLRDPHYFIEAKEIFDKLWEESVEIVSKDNFTEFEEKVVKETFLGIVPSPELIYVRALYEYFETKQLEEEYLPSAITNNKFYDLKYQIDAIEKAVSILRQHNGAIIADVVGLGKTVIASTIAHVLRKKTIIISPPHLVSTWEMYKEDFDFQGKVFSSGKLSDVLDYMEKINSNEFLIIVDESHRFRNNETQNYALLHQICYGNKVILLTATPFNNRPLEIFNLISLFQNPARATFINTKGKNLYYIFKKLDDEFKDARKKDDKEKIKSISEEIRNIINPLIIRRTRLDLQKIDIYREDLQSQNITFPKVNEPQSLTYKLDDIKDKYLLTLEMICPTEENDSKFFRASRYRVTHYIKNFNKYKEQLIEYFGTENFEILHENLSQFMRKLLVRRFESSLEAFKKSIENMMKYTKIMIKWYKAGKVPIYKRGGIIDPELIFDNDYIDEDLLKDEKLESLKEKGYFFIDSKEIKKAFLEDMESDLEILEEIYNMWFSNNQLFKIEDKKLISFKDHLKILYSQKPNRKIVVFSEFIDTVNYLYENLKDDFKTMKYTSEDAREFNRKIIMQEFDANYENQANDVQLLIATDALSEGFNLNRADVLINYDIPYNPTRVIQRVGRINRIGKNVQKEIFIYNYFPSEIGEDETSVKKISTAKIHMFNFIFGTDMKTLTSEEELNSYFAKELSDEEISWDVEFLNDLHRYQNFKKNIYNEALKLPKRVRTKILVANLDGALVFAKEGTNLTFLMLNHDDIDKWPIEKALKLLKEVKNKKSIKVDSKLDKFLEKIKDYKMEIEESVNLSPQSIEFKLLAFLNYNNLNDEYFELLEKVIKLRILPRFYIKQIYELTKNLKDKEECIKKIKNLIPETYLKKLYNGNNKHIKDAEIIFIEQFERQANN